jgi:uncharacterized RDD family membrane protein YckC
MSKPTFRRFLAYLVDAIIIALIAAALANVKFLNPFLDKYLELQEQVQALVEGAGSDAAKISELMNSDEMLAMTYEVNYYGVFVNIYSIVMSFLYFVVFQFYTKGKTLGRLLTKIELVSRDGSDVTFVQLLKRSIIINSLVTGTIMIIMTFALSKDDYLNYVRYVQLIDYGLILVSCGFVLYREDGIGLHDLFAGTRVILSSERGLMNKLDTVKEAEIVEEKEEIIEEKKVVKKTRKSVKK